MYRPFLWAATCAAPGKAPKSSKKMKTRFFIPLLVSMAAFTACSDDEVKTAEPETALSDEYYSGGKNGTVFMATSAAFEQPSPAVTDLAAFKRGEQIFETAFVTGSGTPYSGLGPVYIRKSCISCHPGYGRARRVQTFDPDEYGNGYLVFVHHPDGTIVEGFTAMLQTRAVAPYLPPVENVLLTWNDFTDEYGNQYPDGTPYNEGTSYEGNMSYPTATLSGSIINLPGDYRVSLEATIGIYGTGLLDAIPDEDIVAEADRQQASGGPAMGEHGPWITEAFDGKQHLGKFTYSCNRATLENGPGINALYNITNVTRDDKPYLYITPQWVNAMADRGIDTTGLLGIQPSELQPSDVADFMVWHRGLAVPAARNLDDEEVQRGQVLFYKAGCTSCHKPSWTTGEYSYMPGYSNQKIWPYTDMLRHDMGEINHGRYAKFRTPPLWGRGLMKICAGHTDMFHDLRARNFEEAILWHFGEAVSQREYFRNLDKSDRRALIKFLEAI